ncbi:hypothetical protein EIP86_001675 [Pleurotus ostreatoroseus]|nr:hypothetical protein EIP86_001675 [Pleurotus ostreatoroseus]
MSNSVVGRDDEGSFTLSQSEGSVSDDGTYSGTEHTPRGHSHRRRDHHDRSERNGSWREDSGHDRDSEATADTVYRDDVEEGVGDQEDSPNDDDDDAMVVDIVTSPVRRAKPLRAEPTQREEQLSRMPQRKDREDVENFGMLIPLDQTQETLKFPRTKHTVTIGRVEGMADVIIDDPRITRENQCRIIWDGMDTVKLQHQGTNPTFINGEPIKVKGGYYTLQEDDLVSFAMNLSADDPPPLERDLRYYFKFTGDTMPFDTGDHTSAGRPSPLPPRRSSVSVRNRRQPSSYGGPSRRRGYSRRSPPLEPEPESRRDYDPERDFEREYDISKGYIRAVDRGWATREERGWERVRELPSSSREALYCRPARERRHDRSSQKPYSRTGFSGPPSRLLQEFYAGR